MYYVHSNGDIVFRPSALAYRTYRTVRIWNEFSKEESVKYEYLYICVHYIKLQLKKAKHTY